MPYTKQTWNDDDPATPISAARLTHMENGIDLIDEHEADPVDAHDASAVSVIPYGRNVGTNVQLSLESIEADKARIVNVVDLTSNQAIGGTKTFSSPPVVPTPSTATQAANKSYVDAQTSSGVADESITNIKISPTAAIQQSKIANLTTDIAARQLTSQKGAASGYASLDSSVLVPTAQLGTVTADASKFLRGDRVWAVPISSGGGGSGDGEVILVTDQPTWDPNAADNSIAMQACIDLAKSGNRGGRIIVPRVGLKHASTLNYDYAMGVITEGVAGPPGLGGDLSLQYSLCYTGTGNTTGIRARSGAGCIWRDMRINYNNNGFTGYLLEYRGDWHTSAGGPDTVGTYDAAYGTFENVLFGGTLGGSGHSSNKANLPTNAKGCLMLHNAISSKIIGCTFHYAQNGIVGRAGAGYSNMMVVQGGGATNLLDYAIRDTGDSWLIHGFTFEFNQDQGASGYYDQYGAFGPTVFDGCWWGDATQWNSNSVDNFRPWVHYRGSNLTMRGNMIGSPRGHVNNFPAVYLGDTGFNCEGASFIDNRFFNPYPAVQVRGIVTGIQFIGNNGPNAGALIDFNGNPDYGTTYINNVGGTTTPNGFSGLLRFDDGIKTKTNAFPPIDGHFAAAPPDGTIAVDTGNSRLYVRIGGVWKYAALT